MLSGHTDVVPVDGQVWSSDAFTCVAREGRLYGRGAADMKGFIATALALVPELQALRLAAPVHLALTYDEEVGCKGVPGLLDHLADRLPEPPLGCVVGEPTGMRVANGHKGKAGYVCSVTGLASHSALNHLGVNAIEIAAAIIAELRRLNDEFRVAGPFADGFEPPHCTVSTGRHRRRQRAQHRARPLPLRVRVPARCRGRTPTPCSRASATGRSARCCRPCAPCRPPPASHGRS